MSSADLEHAPQWGPAMAALPTDKQRSFVIGLFMAPKRAGRLLYAVRTAGYGTETSTNNALNVTASRLMSDERIQRAIAEESQKRLRGLSPDVIGAIEALVNNPKHKDHGRALAMVLDRVDPMQTTHNVNVTDNRTGSHLAIKQVIERIEELAQKFDVCALPAPKVIEGECSEVGT